MTNLLSKNFLSPLLVGIAVWIAGTHPAGANPNGSPAAISIKNSPATTAISEPSAEQIETATQASEINPKDWAYQTLQALGTKYGCPTTLTGDKTLSREEFATSLNGCVESIEQLIARKPRRTIRKRPIAPRPLPQVIPQAPEVVSPPTPIAPPEPPAPVDAPEEVVSQQDLDRLKGLVQSFGSELQGVDSRLVAAEAKVATLQKQAFSTTTKLNGEVIIGFSGYNTGRPAGIGTNGTTGNILSDRVRLNFDTSFTGKDRLRTRLESRNTASFAPATGTNMTRLGYDGDGGNSTSVALLNYGFPLTPETKITVDVVGARFNDHLYTHNPILTSSAGGAISRFGRFNPVYRLSTEGAALTINHKFSDELDLAVGYAVPNINSAANPALNNGLFNGSNAIISQLNIRPVKDFSLGLIYGRAYTPAGTNINGSTGSSAANSPFGAVPTSANYYSFQTSYKLSPGFILSGWAGFTEATRETTAGGSASTSNYAVSLAFPDFGSKGNSLAFVLGIPPKLNSRNGTGLAAANAQVAVPTATTTAPGNPDTAYHIEALYRMKLSDNFAITPGILVITNPEHDRSKPTEYVGTVRSTFTF